MYLSSYEDTKMALGSDVTIHFVTQSNREYANKILNNAWRFIYKFERQFSRFLPQSELSVFNRSAGLKQPITREFKDILTSAKAMSQMTGGLYNPFILPALQRSGYLKSAAPGYENDTVDDHRTKKVVPSTKLEIGKDWARIPYGTALDLGGCGKGYLAEKLRAIFSDSKISGYWISLGGDVATFGHDENNKPWIINIQDAENLSNRLSKFIECPEENFAIATSGTFRRKGQHTNKSWHHIIDPISLKPATTDIKLATICGMDALTTDVLASCAVIVGSKKARDYIKNFKVDDYILQFSKTLNGPANFLYSGKHLKNTKHSLETAGSHA